MKLNGAPYPTSRTPIELIFQRCASPQMIMNLYVPLNLGSFGNAL